MKDCVGKRCWQTSGFVHIKFGKVIEQKMDNKWLMVQVQWDTDHTSWENIVNVSFKDIRKL